MAGAAKSTSSALTKERTTKVHTAVTEDVVEDAPPPVNAMGYRYIGSPQPVIEDRRFVRGRGRYINDFSIPGMVYMGVASAPVAHARIISINVEEARKAPGVIAVITGEDLKSRMEPIPQELPLPNVIWYPLCTDKIRYVGEWTAAIVATSRAAAEDAAELVEVEFEELPPVVDPEEALKPEAAVLHEAHGSNVVWHEDFIWGQPIEAFEEADHVFEYKYRWHRHSGVPIETFGVVAQLNKQTEEMNIWASHQNPSLQQEAMNVLRMRARVHVDIDVGGSYGSKRGQKHMYLTAIAAKMTGKAVKFIEDRTENMQAGDGHGPDRAVTMRVAVNNDGIVQALDAYTVEDIGAYNGRGHRRTPKPTCATVGPYDIKHVRFGGYGVLTCKTNQVPFRGSGMSPYNYCLERSMERVAGELGIDRLDFRRRNYIQPDQFPYETPSGATYDSGNYPGVLDLALESVDFQSLLDMQAAARKEGRLVGIGCAGAVEPSGGGKLPLEGARIEIDPRGRVTAQIGFQSAGQAHESMVTQIVCEELGVLPKDVIVLRGHGLMGISQGAPTGSRMTYMLGNALKGTANKVNEKLKLIAAHALEASVEDIVVDHGNFSIAGIPESAINVKQLAKLAYGENAGRPEGMEPGIVETYKFANVAVAHVRKGTTAFPSYAFDFHIPVMEIDPETFQITFLSYMVVHDCGVQINPTVVDGFVFGGIGHGVGGAMYEHFYYDDNGQPQANSFMDYLMPTAAEIPHVDLRTMVTRSPVHPYGAKGSAEGAYMASPAAIASAIDDALSPLGVRTSETPITPQLLFSLVEEAKAKKAASQS